MTDISCPYLKKGTLVSPHVSLVVKLVVKCLKEIKFGKNVDELILMSECRLNRSLTSNCALSGNLPTLAKMRKIVNFTTRD